MFDINKYREVPGLRYRIEQGCRCQCVTENRKIGFNQYILEGKDKLLLQLNNQNGTFKKIVERNGRFTDFPGIEYNSEWMNIVARKTVEEYVKYRAFVFCRPNEQTLFLWEIQPYSFDPGDSDGYGMDETVAIYLYSHLDKEGKFTQPFRLFCIGNNAYYDGLYNFFKVLFLDIDGVLNSERYVRQHPYEGIHIDETRLYLLKQIIEKTDAVIVLSSSWKEHWDSQEFLCDDIGKKINDIFQRNGLYIYDKASNMTHDKEKSIEFWLETHPYVDSFVVIDDIPFAEGILKDRFVLMSNLRDGLDEDDVVDAINILNGAE